MEIPPNKHPINELYVVLSKDKDGNEGIMGIRMLDREYPLVCGYEKTFETMKTMARMEFGAGNEGIRIAKFTAKEDLGPL